MENFPAEFTPENVLNERKRRREKALREKIEAEKVELSAKIVDLVMRGNDERWWWSMKVDKSYEDQTFEELNQQLSQKSWTFGYFPKFEKIILCTREPLPEEMVLFNDEFK